ncbi:MULTISPECIES: glycosyltransferase family 4 protein [unclassified Natrinema]|uniref:glycosyltransferase family 4 protein n=1 Tax=unclassified Natrinema TaxID=2622230 RepID=UPI00026D46B1|nr:MULTISPECIES: glycosyltransferase family 4 protein [unclassified Natrinema]AFO59065.1 glycosyltransferase [Natrinema sp. J7-2]
MDLLVISREFPPHVAGGISYHLKNLYSKIADYGHNITILAGRPQAIATTDSIEIPNSFDINWIDYYSLSGYHLQFPTALYNTLRGFDIHAYDVALTHTEIPFDLGIPTIHKVHDAKHIERTFSRNQMGRLIKIADSALAKTRRWTTQRALDRADRLIFNSKLTESVWKDEYRISSSTHTVYNGVDQEIFYPRDVPDEGYVLFVGNSPRKGLPKVRKFARDGPHPVYVVGDITESKNLRTIGRVDQSELAKYYSSALATVHPANFEAFGNVILESLACGTPVVVSDQCGAAEIVDESCGRVTTDLSEGIKSVSEISAEFCVAVAENYSWDCVAETTESVIKGTIGKQ